VLAEEEVVAVDLQSEGWQQYRPPYLCSLHSSAITAVSHVGSVPEALWTKIVDAGEGQVVPGTSGYSSREWPITGGQIQQQNDGLRELLLTG
jgi:lethal(2) giant larvae protein